jgi:hypothetical protein
MPFLPREFQVPEPPATSEFVLTPLRVDHVVLDYDAVMSSRERLWQLFGPGWGWPCEDLSLMQDLVDLGWHQKEFQLRRSCSWAVLTPDQRTMRGCCCLDPSEPEGFDAEGCCWARSDRVASGLEERLSATCRAWLAAAWEFQRVAWSGRDRPW